MWSWFCIAVLPQCVLIVRANSTKESATSTIGASSSNDPDAQVDALRERRQQSSAARGAAALRLLCADKLARHERLRLQARQGQSYLSCCPPIWVPPQLDASKKTYRTYLAFPYGVLTIASYLKRFAAALGQVEILDLNLPGDEPPEARLARKLAVMTPDIVGFSMSYDVSYPWLRSMAAAVRQHDSKYLHRRRRSCDHDGL